MPKRKRRYHPKRKRRRLRGRSAGRRALTLVKRVIRNQEKHTFEKNWSGRHIYGAGAVTGSSTGAELVTAIAQGDGRDERVGNNITGMYGTMRLVIDWNNAGGTIGNDYLDPWVRFAIVQDRNTNENAPPQLFQATTDDNVIAGTGPLAEWQVQTRTRYKILKSGIIRPVWSGPPVTGAGLRPSHVLRHFKLPRDIRFNGQAATDFSKNVVYLFIWCNDSSFQHESSVQLRIWYKDD